MGKTATIVVHSAAGGGNDSTARLYSQFLGRFLPGKPSMLVRNMPGGGSTIGPNHVYGSRPDGLTLLSAAGASMTNDLLKVKAARYEIAKMPAVIGFGGISTVYYIRSGIINKPEDIVNAKGIIYGGSGLANTLGFLCAKEFIGIPTAKTSLGYGGTGDALRAFHAGEIDMSSSSSIEYLNSLAPFAAKGEVMVAFQTGLLDAKGNLKRQPNAPPSPTAQELYETIYGKPPSGMAWEAFKALTLVSCNIDKILLLPPGTPDNIVRAYWDAAANMVKDAEFLKLADARVGTTVFQTGEAFQSEFRANLGMDPKIVDWLKTSMSAKYGIVFD